VEVRIHPLFWLVIFLSVWTGHFLEILTLFVLVIVHELGHVTAAWAYGWRVESMMLLPFGGVAKIDEWGTVSTREEIIVALAGPFYHIWMILVSYLFYSVGLWTEVWMKYFIQSNLLIMLFNLLPIYPLDGGKVFQAVLSYWIPYRPCIWWTHVISMALSGVLLVLSFLFPGQLLHLPLFTISIFLLVSNWKEMKQMQIHFLRFLLARHHRKNLEPYEIHSVTVKWGEPLQNVFNKWYKERYHVFKMISPQGETLDLIPEEVILQKYFQNPSTVFGWK
jgi:stage IV sporulation protein FB